MSKQHKILLFVLYGASGPVSLLLNPPWGLSGLGQTLFVMLGSLAFASLQPIVVLAIFLMAQYGLKYDAIPPSAGSWLRRVGPTGLAEVARWFALASLLGGATRITAVLALHQSLDVMGLMIILSAVGVMIGIAIARRIKWDFEQQQPPLPPV